MDFIEFCWLNDWPLFKTALQETLGSSGQLLKKHFSSKDLARSIRKKEVIRLPIDLTNHMSINPQFVGPSPIILKETADYLVLHKPAGVHTHPHCYSDQDTLLNFLAQNSHWKALEVNKANYDRGLLYRLDYETSGIMLVAKSEEYFSEMRSNFKVAMKSKFYWAIVEGDFDQEGLWTHYFKGTSAKGSKQRVEASRIPESDEGSLEVRKVMSSGNKSLVLVNLNSGLRHQIRAQLSFLGFPILGDELYGGSKAERLFLHAWRYEWNEIEEDNSPDLFDRFFDLNSGLQVSHDMLRVFKSR
jgi:23S rRNA pseudouridine1911/1915/1917 synthase